MAAATSACGRSPHVGQVPVLRRCAAAISTSVAAVCLLGPTLEVLNQPRGAFGSAGQHAHAEAWRFAADCEAISQALAAVRRVRDPWPLARAGLAMIMFEKFGQHQPLNRQAERYAREGVPLSLSTLADQVGACTAALMPLFDRLQAHVMAAERLHGGRHHGSGARERQDGHRPRLGLCA